MSEGEAEYVPEGGYPRVPREVPDGGPWRRGETFRVLPNGDIGPVTVGENDARVYEVHLEGRPARRWGGLRFTVTLAETDSGRFELIATAVRPLTYDEQLTANGSIPVVSDRLPDRPPRLLKTRLDEIPWGELAAVGQRSFSNGFGRFQEFDAWTRDQPRRRGRPPVPADRLVRAAAAYVAAFDSGSRSPTKDVAERQGVTAAHVNKLLDKAVSRGLFKRTGGAGRPGGVLTAEGRRLLDSIARPSRVRSGSGPTGE